MGTKMSTMRSATPSWRVTSHNVTGDVTAQPDSLTAFLAQTPGQDKGHTSHVCLRVQTASATRLAAETCFSGTLAGQIDLLSWLGGFSPLQSRQRPDSTSGLAAGLARRLPGHSGPPASGAGPLSRRRGSSKWLRFSKTNKHYSRQSNSSGRVVVSILPHTSKKSVTLPNAAFSGRACSVGVGAW